MSGDATRAELSSPIIVEAASARSIHGGFGDGALHILKGTSLGQ